MRRSSLPAHRANLERLTTRRHSSQNFRGLATVGGAKVDYPAIVQNATASRPHASYLLLIDDDGPRRRMLKTEPISRPSMRLS